MCKTITIAGRTGQYALGHSLVGTSQYEAQSAERSATADLVKRFNVLFLVVAQLALRFKQSKCCPGVLLRCELKKCYNFRFIALRTVKVGCAL